MTKMQVERWALKEILEKKEKRESEFFDSVLNLRKTDEVFKELDDKFRNLALAVAKNEADEKDFKNAETKRDVYLKNHKIVLGKPSCEKCNDTGYVENKKCGCLENLIYSKLQKQSGISTLNLKMFKDSNFDVFDEKHRENAKKVYFFFENAIKNFKNNKTVNYVVCGKSGVGKTFLFSAIAGELLKKEISTLFVTSFTLNNIFLKYHTTFTSDRLDFLLPVLECDALIVDDLGTEQILKNVTLEYFLMVLKERLLSGKKTFINTNLTPDKINEIYGERIYSRLFDKAHSIAINFENENLRV